MKKYGIPVLILFLGVLFGCSKSSNGNDPDTPKPIDKSANLLATGDSAQDILSNETFDKLIIEVAYVSGFKPTVEAMNSLTLYLKQYTFKDNIELLYTELESPNEESLTLDKIADLESENRTAYNNGKTLAFYIYFADSPAEDDDEEKSLVTLGAVYRNTSMVIHEVTVRKLSNQSILITDGDVETATLNHEFGHLFGLVNLGSPPVNDHEDVEAINHCNVVSCLMRAELQFGGSLKKSNLSAKNGANTVQAGCILSGHSVLQMLEQQASKGLAAAPDLDSECVLDLQANGGK